MTRRLDEQPIPYDGRNLRFYRRQQEAIAHAKLLAKLALEADDGATFKRPARAADAADGRTLRGLPAIGPNVGGAIPGTSPEAEIIRRDEQRRRRA